MPCVWLPGDSLASTGVSDVEVVAAGELVKCEDVDEADPARKRKKTVVDPDVKDWFFDYHECMKVRHKWNVMQSLRRAQEMLSSLLKDVHDASHTARSSVQQPCESGGSDFTYVSDDLGC